MAARFGDNVPPHQRHPVAWYRPDVLLSVARRVLSSTDMLRNRIAADGKLHAHFVAIDQVPRRWRPRGGDGRPFWVPDGADAGATIATRVRDRFEL